MFAKNQTAVAMFPCTVLEVLGPIDAPRYIVEGPNGRRYHVGPDQLIRDTHTVTLAVESDLPERARAEAAPVQLLDKVKAALGGVL